jgi:hypothetical protein
LLHDRDSVAAAVWFVWAYVPDKWLALLDITYYPSKYWAAALPLYVLSVRGQFGRLLRALTLRSDAHSALRWL